MTIGFGEMPADPEKRPKRDYTSTRAANATIEELRERIHDMETHNSRLVQFAADNADTLKALLCRARSYITTDCQLAKEIDEVLKQ